MSSDWEELLEHAVASFGSTPGDSLRTRFAQEAQRHPETVRATINRLANRQAAGEIASPWGILSRELDKLADVAPKAKAGNDQAKALTRAEQRMRAEFLHYDRWSEIHDELFREGASLHPWPHLEPQLHQLWEELRPAGILTEQQAEERQRKYAHDHADMAAAAKAKRLQLDQTQAEPKAAA